MVALKSRENGFVVVLGDMVTLEDAILLRHQLRDEWAGMGDPFVLVLDIRSFRYFSADAQALVEELLEEALDEGLARVSVLGVSTAFAGQFCNMMVRTEVMPIYQFLDLAYEEDWRAEMERWLSGPFAMADA